MKRRQAIQSIGTALVGLASRQAPPSLLVRGGRVVNADGSRDADVLVSGERIQAIGVGLTPPPGARVVEAAGHIVIPGGIDPHTHLQGSFVDDLTSGTTAALAGGITTVGTFAYPADGETPVDAMVRSLEEAATKALGDVFFHASLWPPEPESIALLPDLVALGQPSHKVFMTRPDFRTRTSDFIELLESARDRGMVTLMHCEDGDVLRATLRRLRAEERTSLQHYAESRPVVAEVTATQQAVALCELTGAPMHFVHLSCERALDAARHPHAAGLPLTVETRPLYLYFDDTRLLGADGPLYVGQPPLRAASDVDAMWEGLSDGRIDFLATDHAPWTRAQKLDPSLDIGRLRPGVSDLRFMLPVLFSEGVSQGRISQERFVEVTSTAAARTFGLFPERGVLRDGALADITIIDPTRQRVVAAADDPSRSDYTPFEGWNVTGWPIVTIRRGEIVYENETVTAAPGSGQPAARTPRRAEDNP